MFNNHTKYSNDIISEVNYIKNSKIKMLYNNIIVLHHKIDDLDIKFTKLLKSQQYTLNEILLNIERKNVISKSTSISSLFLDSSKNTINNNDLSTLVAKTEKNEDEKNEDEKNEKDYYEILNECYDNIPLNNLKKTTGLKGWLF